MNKQTGTTERMYRSIATIVVWFALGLQLYIIIRSALNNQISLVSETIRFFSYFTILTNIMVALCFTCPLLSPSSRAGQYFSRSYVQAGIAVYIAIVGITYSLLLRQLWKPQGSQLIADRLLHDVMPIVYVLFWLIFVRKGNLKWSYAFSWLLYPAIYLAYVLIRGAVTDAYPYPFIDVTDLGYDGMLVNSLFMLAGFIVVGLLFISIDYLVGKRARSVAL
jgi:hypothetical protein